jgi:iron-sulfur cluster repair protein YtfE (RIC family)
MNTFSDLLNLHKELDRIFFEHQCALLRFEFDRASERLEFYEKCLRIHMRDEEEILLPLYAVRCQIDPRGTVQIYLDDHAKMLAHLKLFSEHIEKLIAEPQPEADLILLLDREAFFKRLCSHHDRREGEILYPELEANIPKEERARLFEDLTLHFESAASEVMSGSFEK